MAGILTHIGHIDVSGDSRDFDNVKWIGKGHKYHLFNLITTRIQSFPSTQNLVAKMASTVGYCFDHFRFQLICSTFSTYVSQSISYQGDAGKENYQ